MQAHVFSHSHLLKMTDGPAIVDALLSRPVKGLNILLEKAFHHALLNAAKVRNAASRGSANIAFAAFASFASKSLRWA